MSLVLFRAGCLELPLSPCGVQLSPSQHLHCVGCGDTRHPPAGRLETVIVDIHTLSSNHRPSQIINGAFRGRTILSNHCSVHIVVKMCLLQNAREKSWSNPGHHSSFGNWPGSVFGGVMVCCGGLVTVIRDT